MLVTEDDISMYHRMLAGPAYVNGLIQKILFEYHKLEDDILEEESIKEYARQAARATAAAAKRARDMAAEEPPHREPSPLPSDLKNLRRATEQLKNRSYREQLQRGRERLQRGRERLEEIRIQPPQNGLGLSRYSHGPPYPHGPRYPHGGKRTKRERKNRKRHTQRRK